MCLVTNIPAQSGGKARRSGRRKTRPARSSRGNGASPQADLLLFLLAVQQVEIVQIEAGHSLSVFRHRRKLAPFRLQVQVSYSVCPNPIKFAALAGAMARLKVWHPRTAVPCWHPCLLFAVAAVFTFHIEGSCPHQSLQQIRTAHSRVALNRPQVSHTKLVTLIQCMNASRAAGPRRWLQVEARVSCLTYAQACCLKEQASYPLWACRPIPVSRPGTQCQAAGTGPSAKAPTEARSKLKTPMHKRIIHACAQRRQDIRQKNLTLATTMTLALCDR